MYTWLLLQSQRERERERKKEGKKEGKRKDGCLVNDDNNKTETQWKLLHQPRVSPLPSCCFLSYHAPNPLFRLVLRQISTYNRRLTSASQNGWKKSEHLLSKFPRIIHILVHREHAASWRRVCWRRWKSFEWWCNVLLLWTSMVYYNFIKVSKFYVKIYHFVPNYSYENVHDCRTVS